MESTTSLFLKASITRLARFVSSNAIAVLIAIATTFSLAIFSHIQQSKLPYLWSTEYQNYQATRTIINRFYQLIGYGGYIHHFKNVVLRKDPQLLEKVNAESQTLLENIQSLKNRYQNDAETLQLIAEIETTFLAYREKQVLLGQAITEDWPPEKTDALVKINDDATVSALKKITELNNTEFEQSIKAIDERIGFFSWIHTLSLIFLILTVIIALLLLWRKRELIEKTQMLEKDLASAEKVYEGTLDSLVDSCIITDDKGIIQRCNPYTMEMFEYRPEELIGENITILIPEGEHKHQHHQYMASAEMRKKILAKGRELYAQTKSGKQIPVEITIPMVEN